MEIPTRSRAEDPAPEASDGAQRTPGWSTRSTQLAVLALAVAAMVHLAWIADDSLITLRAVLNWENGWGPVFNPAEAVQSYTHPAWFLLWALFGRLTGEWIMTIAALSLVLASAAFLMAISRGRSPQQVLAIGAGLLLSNAFMEYSISGMENPLAHLLVGLLILLSLSGEDRIDSDRRMIPAGLLLAALALTRLDLTLLALPAAALYAWRRRGRPRKVLIGGVSVALPLIAWFAWSYHVYAAFLPNTFAAKVNIDIPTGEILVQGLRYLTVTVTHDPGTGLAAAASVAVILAWGGPMQRGWLLGAALYVGYVVWVGGDFMAGRFLSAPLFALVIVAASCWSERRPARLELPGSIGSRARAGALAVGTVAALLAGMAALGRAPALVSPNRGERWDFGTHAGVADERGIHIERGKGVLESLRSARSAPQNFAFRSPSELSLSESLNTVRAAALSWPERNKAGVKPLEVGVRCGVLGLAGMLSGPRVHWIDQCALTDRYLAQKVFSASGFKWRVGHYYRPLPNGYEEAVRFRDPSLLADPREAAELAELWARIQR